METLAQALEKYCGQAEEGSHTGFSSSSFIRSVKREKSDLVQSLTQLFLYVLLGQG